MRAGYCGPNARWVMHSNTYKAALALLDSGGHPVFDREKGTMFGAPVVCDDLMAQIGASAKVAVFGDFKRGLVGGLRSCRPSPRSSTRSTPTCYAAPSSSPHVSTRRCPTPLRCVRWRCIPKGSWRLGRIRDRNPWFGHPP